MPKWYIMLQIFTQGRLEKLISNYLNFESMKGPKRITSSELMKTAKMADANQGLREMNKEVAK